LYSYVEIIKLINIKMARQMNDATVFFIALLLCSMNVSIADLLSEQPNELVRPIGVIGVYVYLLTDFLPFLLLGLLDWGSPPSWPLKEISISYSSSS